MPGKDCSRNANLLKPGCIPKENTLKVGDPLGKSSKMGGKGRTQKGNPFKFGDPRNMRRAVMINWVEERRNKLYVEKLEKNLNTRLREIDREMAATDKFLEKLYNTTGHFANIKFWWE